jgi:hypothetical protein
MNFFLSLRLPNLLNDCLLFSHLAVWSTAKETVFSMNVMIGKRAANYIKKEVYF